MQQQSLVDLQRSSEVAPCHDSPKQIHPSLLRVHGTIVIKVLLQPSTQRINFSALPELLLCTMYVYVQSKDGEFYQFRSHAVGSSLAEHPFSMSICSPADTSVSITLPDTTHSLMATFLIHKLFNHGGKSWITPNAFVQNAITKTTTSDHQPLLICCETSMAYQGKIVKKTPDLYFPGDRPTSLDRSSSSHHLSLGSPAYKLPEAD